MNLPKISLRWVLIGINLTVLLLPLAGIQLMRLYESALVRQTESALIAQAAFVAASYRAALIEESQSHWRDASRDDLSELAKSRSGGWLPRYAELDLATSPVLPPFPDGRTHLDAHTLSARVGRRLNPVLKDAQLITLAGIRVVDPWGVIVASTGNDLGQSIAHGEEVDLALRGEFASRLRQKLDQVQDTALSSISRTSRVRVFVSSPVMLDERLIGAVMLSRTPPSIGQALYHKRWLLLQGLTLLLAIVVLMSWLTSRLISRPITRLADHASRISRAEVTTQAAVSALQQQDPRTSEVARLQDALIDMTNTLEQRAAYLQEFARHVSHEFKTPIAGIRGAVEVLQDHGETMSHEQRQRFLTNVSDDAARLDRLTARLMDLTKAEMQQGQIESFNLVPLLIGTQQVFQSRLSFDFEPPAEALVRSDPSAVQAVLDVLLENALQHGASSVRLHILDQDSKTALLIEDNGEGISCGNREQVFTPFFTTQRDQGGTGLGLTIARTLIQQSEGDLQLSATQPERGASFTLTLLKPHKE